MAKKRSQRARVAVLEESVQPPDKQTWIEGTEPPPLPEIVEICRDEYVKAMRQKNGWATRMKSKEEELISAMAEHDIDSLIIDEGKKRLVVSRKPKIKTESNKTEDSKEKLEEV